MTTRTPTSWTPTPWTPTTWTPTSWTPTPWTLSCLAKETATLLALFGTIFAAALLGHAFGL